MCTKELHKVHTCARARTLTHNHTYSCGHAPVCPIHAPLDSDGTPCSEVLRTGLESIKLLGAHMLETFESEVVRHREAPSSMQE
jgi:hypothetical protein